MIIQNHNINLDSTRVFSQHNESEEHLVAWNGNTRLQVDNRQSDGKIELSRDFQQSEAAQVDFSDNGMKQLLDTLPKFSPVVKADNGIYFDEEDMEGLSPELYLAQQLLEKLFGIKIDIVKFGDSTASHSADNATSANGQASDNAQAPAQNLPEPQPAGWGIRYSYHEVHYEKEAVQFSAGGKVTTQDGREINFDMKLEMAREKLEEINVQFNAGDALVDPLAINLDGLGVKLTAEKYQFDLNADGEKENISFVQQGSGFLVLDKNQNGIVDDGSELFGPESNNGFLELRAYDQDQNDWIDEKDQIFYDLKLWTKNQDGTDQLTGLSNYDVGAIYLESVQTKLDLEGGQLKESGIYLKENGQVNVIQEVDLESSEIIA